ncbi:hypothetical protein [Mesorhizobium sp. WSM4904]|uniref:hypothetical protein n=1 Tax=Mesorhizobium sp. WSM4904 TaxID=3038545 RepID=UPI002418227E|nr:hypothetical protein [Mesorhizobium sp. WSM4904]WFP61483.1 hypothetical protein QAZ47_23800 [Mesorhizobium sp. WSM4904]
MADGAGKARRKIAGASTARAKPARAKPAAAPVTRQKRSRKTLGDDFATALRADFRAYGAGVIAAVRAEKPEQYLKVVLTMLPKEFSQGLDANQNSLGQLSDEELRIRIRSFEARLRPFLDGDADLSGAARGVGPTSVP